MKQWLMIQNFRALKTMYRKTLDKQATYKTPKNTEKQLDYIFVDKKHLYCNRDAEANDMIHMGSDHRKCRGTIRDYSTKQKIAQKKHIAKKKMKTAENTTSQNDERTRATMKMRS